jgi:ubiquinone/menaquinone biosynthesis C-methylase UbiE
MTCKKTLLFKGSSIFSKIVGKVKSIILPRLGQTSYYEGVWEARSIFDVNQYLSNHDMPSRAWLASIIKNSTDYYGIKFPKVLEIGCGWGANLYTLSQLLPKSCELVGIDISSASIDSGRKHLSDLNATNISLHLGRADDLNRFADNLFDVVLVDAVLMYIADDKIDKTISEMGRVSKKLIFILELNTNAKKSTSTYSSDGWMRNYNHLIETSNLECDIEIYEITEEIRSSGRWPSQGKLLKLISKNKFK